MSLLLIIRFYFLSFKALAFINESVFVCIKIFLNAKSSRAVAPTKESN